MLDSKMEKSLYEFEWYKQFFCHYMDIFSKQITDRKFMLKKSLAFITVRRYIYVISYDCTPCLNNDATGN